jgi:cytoskeletal protein CcmA (bactofilin family)
MWKRDEAVKPTVPAGSGSAPAPTVVPPAAEAAKTHSAPSEPQRGMERTTVNIGKSVVIKGELSGSEDLTIEGQVDGKIELRQNVLTIGPNGKIKAQVFAKSVVILGEVTGNVTASEKVDIRDNGSVDGDIAAPRVAIAEGAHFRGSIDMQRAGAGAGATTKAADQKEQKADTKPAAAPAQPASASTSPSSTSGATAGAR